MITGGRRALTHGWSIKRSPVFVGRPLPRRLRVVLVESLPPPNKNESQPAGAFRATVRATFQDPPKRDPKIGELDPPVFVPP